MKKLLLAIAAFATLGAASPAMADDDDRRGWRGRGYEHGEWRGRGRDWRDDRGRGRDWRDDRWRGHDGRYGWRGDDRWRGDRRDDRRVYRDGFRDGRRFDDRFEDRRIYRDGFRDGRRFDGYAYRPYFRERAFYGRPYYRYDYFDGPWSRPYVIGRPLPPRLGYRRIDAGYYGLPPCPRGHYYADVGGDILLISLATGLIVDALIGY